MARNQGRAAGQQAAKDETKGSQAEAAASEEAAETQAQSTGAQATEGKASASEAAPATKTKVVWVTDTKHNGKFYKEGEEAELDGHERSALLKHGVLKEVQG